MKRWQLSILGTLGYFAFIGALPIVLVLPVTVHFFAFFFIVATALDAVLRRLLRRGPHRGVYNATVVTYQLAWSYAATHSLMRFPLGSPLPGTYTIIAAIALSMALVIRIDGAATSRSPERLVVLATLVAFVPSILVAIAMDESMIVALEHAAWAGGALAAVALPLAIASHRARERDLAQPATAVPPSTDAPTPTSAPPWP